jgi:hypothetical protein
LGHERNGIFFNPDSARSDSGGDAAAIVPAALVLPTQSGIVAASPASTTTALSDTPRSESGEARPVKSGVLSDATARMIALTGAGHAQTVDHVFSDLDGGTLGNAL